MAAAGPASSADPPTMAAAPQDLARLAGNEALKRVTDFESFSSLRKKSNERGGGIMQLDWDDLDRGPLVGEGAFSSVYTVTLLRPRRLESFLSFSDDEEEQDRKGSGRSASLHQARTYALKCLQPYVTKDQKSFTSAAVDLALEAHLLSRLSHEHIISIHGVTAGCISTSFSENDGGFFLLLDLMVDTLDRKLDAWEERESQKGFRIRNITPRSWKPFHHKTHRQQLDRLEHVALGIARGLEYLHDNNVMYRDLKPQNIGFDENDVVRIFDFGLAREVDQARRDKGIEMRQLTGEAGTPRYMAPEVARKEGFDFSSDIYSFSLLLWEICTLQKPFEEYKSRVKFENCVVHGGVRPPLQKIAFPKVARVVQEGWDDDPRKRASMRTMREAIEDVLQEAHEREVALLKRRSRRGRFLPARKTAEFASTENTGELDTCSRRRTSFGLGNSRHSSEHGGKPGSFRVSFSHVLPTRRHSESSLIEAAAADAAATLEVEEAPRRRSNQSGSFASVASANSSRGGSRRGSGASQGSAASRRLDDSRGSKRSTLAEAMIETLAMEAKENKKLLRQRSLLRSKLFRKSTRKTKTGTAA